MEGQGGRDHETADERRCTRIRASRRRWPTQIINMSLRAQRGNLESSIRRLRLAPAGYGLRTTGRLPGSPEKSTRHRPVPPGHRVLPGRSPGISWRTIAISGRTAYHSSSWSPPCPDRGKFPPRAGRALVPPNFYPGLRGRPKPHQESRKSFTNTDGDGAGNGRFLGQYDVPVFRLVAKRRSLYKEGGGCRWPSNCLPHPRHPRVRIQLFPCTSGHPRDSSPAVSSSCPTSSVSSHRHCCNSWPTLLRNRASGVRRAPTCTLQDHKSAVLRLQGPAASV